jgi:hypothetical protein
MQKRVVSRRRDVLVLDFSSSNTPRIFMARCFTRRAPWRFSHDAQPRTARPVWVVRLHHHQCTALSPKGKHFAEGSTHIPPKDSA